MPRQLLPLSCLQERDTQSWRILHSARVKTGPLLLEVDLLRHLESVIDLDAKVSDRALELSVSE